MYTTDKSRSIAPDTCMTAEKVIYILSTIMSGENQICRALDFECAADDSWMTLQPFTRKDSKRQKSGVRRKKTASDFFFFFTCKQWSERGRESERCEGAHCPHVAKQLPAEPTSPSSTITQVGGRQTLTSDLWPCSRCWETSKRPIVARAYHLPAFSQSRQKSDGIWWKGEKQGAHREKEHLQSERWRSPLSVLPSLVRSSFFALVENICRGCVSVKSLLCGWGQEVTMSLWVTAVMASWGYI